MGQPGHGKKARQLRRGRGEVRRLQTPCATGLLIATESVSHAGNYKLPKHPVAMCVSDNLELAQREACPSGLTGLQELCTVVRENEKSEQQAAVVGMMTTCSPNITCSSVNGVVFSSLVLYSFEVLKKLKSSCNPNIAKIFMVQYVPYYCRKEAKNRDSTCRSRSTEMPPSVNPESTICSQSYNLSVQIPQLVSD